MCDKNLADALSSSSWEDDVIFRGYSLHLPMNDAGFVPIGGDMGSADTDFEVSEIPAYVPCGSGEHLYLWVEKKGKATQDLTRAVEKAFKVKEIDVGCAGKKDAHAVTRQYISVRLPKEDTEGLEQLRAHSWLNILEISRHTNKLRTGHLRGNRFKVNLYGVTSDDAQISHACAMLSAHGFINYFGKQRFGFEGDNVRQGLSILCGARARHQTKKFVISALQSALFNLMAGRRFLDKGFDVCDGDVMQKVHAGCFVCDDVATDALRAKSGEIVVTLPLPGKKTMHGHGYSMNQEQSACELFLQSWRAHDEQYSELDLNTLAGHADGSRRPLWIYPEDVRFERLSADSISVAFSLPSGCYATVFLRHLCGSSFTR